MISAIIVPTTTLLIMTSNVGGKLLTLKNLFPFRINGLSTIANKQLHDIVLLCNMRPKDPLFLNPDPGIYMIVPNTNSDEQV